MTLIMGVVNVTPDSFSDGGRWFDETEAIAHGQRLLADGADILDIGGESTRPGASRVPLAEELRRVVPVVRALADAGATVSVDTMRSQVAAAALDAGARIVNDVSGGLADPAMAPLVADAGVTFVAMHWRGHSADMNSRAVYADVVADVRTELSARVEELRAAGIPREHLVIDPGLGFAKEPHHNWSLLAHLDQLAELGYPVLIGASRKRFLTRVEEGAGRGVRAFADSDPETAAVGVLCALAGVWCVRVHDVDLTRRALAVAGAYRAAGGPGPGRGGEPAP